MDQQKAEREAAVENWKKMNGLADELETTMNLADTKVRDFAFDLGDPDGALARGLNDFAANVKKELLDTQNANSVLSSYEKLSQKIVDSVTRAILGLGS